RMYNVYGPRQALDNPYQGVLGIFLGNLLRGEPLTIFGDGNQSRDFVYVDDVADAWSRALAPPSTYSRAFNIGIGRRVCINKAVDEILAAFGESRAGQVVTYAPPRSGEQRHVEADITSITEALGWRPTTSFRTGLGRTCQWATRDAGVEGFRA